MKRFSLLSSAFALGAAAVPAISHAAFIDFESDTGTTISASEFTPSTATAFTLRTDSKAFGLNSIKPGSSDANAMYSGTSDGFTAGAFGFTPGGTFTESIFFRFSKTNVVTGTAQRLIQLGISNNNNNIANFFSQNNALSTRVNYNGGTYDSATGTYPGTFQLQTISISTGTTVTANNGSTFTLVDNHIYKFDTNITAVNIATGLFSIDSALVDYGTTGLTAGATIVSVTGEAVTDAGFANNLSNVFTGIRSISSTGGIAFDNFTAVPEPTMLSLAGVGIGLTALRRRVR